MALSPELPSATRILHTEASRGWGGQEIRILTEIAAMRCRGHELWLACAPDSELAKRAKLPVVSEW